MKPCDVFGPKEKAEYRRLLDEIGEDYCPEGKYCLFKEFLINAHPSRRLMVQLKCVDRLKLLWSKDLGKDVGWEYALQRWVDDGNAVKFAEFYTEEKHEKDIFKEIISKK
jgi:hypothetical protein